MGDRLRLLAIALTAGLFAGGISGASAASNVGLCTPEPGSACHELVRVLALRVGLVVTVATVVMLLTVVGLARTMVLDEQRRMAQANHPDYGA